MSEGRVSFAREDAVARLTFDNPARHNAVSLAMWREAASALEDAAIDPAVRVLVVSGAGPRAFVSGADISRFADERATQAAVREYNAAAERAYDLLAEFPRPTIAAVRGWCLGGGVAIAACCDLRLAAEGARFGVPAAKLGLGYGFAGIRRLVGLIGPANTLDLFFTARHVPAADARAMGFVNRIAPEDGFDALVAEYVAAIGANAPLTLAQVKRAVREALVDPAERDLDSVARMIEGCFASADYREGRTAFVEKRAPRFRGE